MRTIKSAAATIAAGLLMVLAPACNCTPPPACDSSTCAGCCNAAEACENGLNASSCGARGVACRPCAASEQCVSGACSPLAGCSAATCPSGCCSLSGCMPGTSDSACGQAGAVCIACAAGQSCSSGACAPNVDAGPDAGPDAGGTDGGRDGGRDAGPGWDAGSCNYSNCPYGCCSGSLCLPGNLNTSCGDYGQQCQTCGYGQACLNQSCLFLGDAGSACSAYNCAGCCYGSGPSAICLAGNSDGSCGAYGQACTSCGYGQSCIGNKCQLGDGGGSWCNSSSCPGCCSGSGPSAICLVGNTNANCGYYGQTCMMCGYGQACIGQTCQYPYDAGSSCNASNCSGCCYGSGPSAICLLGNTNSNCGYYGQACKSCGYGQSCIGQTCQFTGDGGGSWCNSSTCSGCCSGSGPSAICLMGNTNSNCGYYGQACANCSYYGQSCIGQTCQFTGGDGGSWCNASNCPGCCSGSGPSAICLLGNSNSNCGYYGQACANCSYYGQSCLGGLCQYPGDGGGSTCGPWNCSGCCSGPPGYAICLLGTTTLNCGIGGQACQSCDSATGQTCVANACTGGNDGGASGTLGSACTTASECAGVGGTPPLCKQTSSYGNLSYPGGYCTRRCYLDAQCGPNGVCEFGLGPLGEAENICMLKCSGPGTCSRAGYACLDFSFGSGPAEWACWMPAPDGGTTLTGFPTVDAGPFAGAGVMGGACSLDSQCRPPDTGACVPGVNSDGGPSGFTGGACTAECSYGLYTPGFCGDGGYCQLYHVSVPGQDPLVSGYCEQECDPLAAPGTCRTGYYCEQIGVGRGKCSPRCDAPGAECPVGATCSDGGACL